MSDTSQPRWKDSTLTEREVSELSPEKQVKHAIESGCRTLHDITDVTHVTEDWTKRVLSDLVDADVLRVVDDSPPRFAKAAARSHDDTSGPDADAEPDADRKESVADRDTDDTVSETPTADADSRFVPVDRDYDWNSQKLSPPSVAEYVDTNGELEDIRTSIEHRYLNGGKLPRFRVKGPTGCGKTTLGESLAVDFDAPCFIVECHAGLRPGSLLGTTAYKDDGTVWVDGPVTRALLASQAASRPDTDFEEVFLIFDEVNRAKARTLSVIMSALDHRAEVTLNGRGGEVVEGDAMNLVTVATMNKGSGYQVNQMDRAQKRRFGSTFSVDYLGRNNIDAEVELITSESGVDDSAAHEMVSVANEIRQKADERSSPIEMGVPTSQMLDWAKTATMYEHAGRYSENQRLVEAARCVLLETFYTEDREEDTVDTLLSDYLLGVSVTEGTPDDDATTADESDETEEVLDEIFADGESETGKA